MVWNFRKILEPDGVRWSVVGPGRIRKSWNLADEGRMPLEIRGGFFWIVGRGQFDQRAATGWKNCLQIDSVPDCLISFTIDHACDRRSAISKRRDREWQQRRLPVTAHRIARRKGHALDK